MIPSGTESVEERRSPWIGVVVVSFLLLIVQGPMVGAEPAWMDAELGSGRLAFDGWLPGTGCARLECATTGSLGLHRTWSLLLQLAALACVPGVARWARVPWTVVLTPVTVWLLHPAHLESSFRLALRPVLYSEVLLWIGVVLFAFGRWRDGATARAARGAGALFLGMGAAGMPAVSAAALPLLAMGRPRDRFAALALLAGAATQFAVSVSALGEFSWPRWGGLWRTVFDPNSAGVVKSAGSSLVLWTLLAGLPLVFWWWGRRRRVAGILAWGFTSWLAACIALRLSPVRPESMGLVLGLAPETALVPAALWSVTVALCLPCVHRSLAPIFVLGLLLVSSGWARQRAFDSEDRYFEAALMGQESDPVLQRLRGESLLRTLEERPPAERLERATEAYHRAQAARRLGGATREVEVLEIRALTWMGRAESARRSLETLLAETPSDLSLRTLRGDIEMLDDRPLEALTWYRSVRNSSMDSPLASERYARALERCYERIQRAIKDGALEDARRMCRLLIEAASEERVAAELSAHTFVAEGRDQDAIAAFEEVRSRYPQSQVALKALVLLYEQHGAPERAMELRQELLRIGGMQAFR